MPAFEGIRWSVDEIDGRTRLTLATPARDYGVRMLSLRGRHQAANAVVAVRLIEELEALGLPIRLEAMTNALEHVQWRGRLELLDLPGRGRVLLDAAHNPAGAAALGAYLNRFHPRGLPIVFAAMRDKNWRGMLGYLVPRASAFVVTRPSNDRAEDPERLAAAASELGAMPVSIVAGPSDALDYALTLSDSVAVTGSIFLVGELLARLDAVRQA